MVVLAEVLMSSSPSRREAQEHTRLKNRRNELCVGRDCDRAEWHAAEPDTGGQFTMSKSSLSTDDVMLSLRRKALQREQTLNDYAINDGETGAVVDEHSDTWAFSWMPAIEEFVDSAATAARANEDESDENGAVSPDGDDSDGAWEGDVDRNEGITTLPTAKGKSDVNVAAREKVGRKRMRPPSGPSAPFDRRPRPPSYNETLLADKAFHNPHGSETMADAFGIVRPLSFLLDVADDDRTWGEGAAAAAAVTASEGRSEKDDERVERKCEGSSRSWFYDTVRDRQNRLWADSRVKKGVELARKGQHQSAIDTYTQALGMCPDHEDGLVARGAGYATTGRLRQALQDLSRALSLNPDNENASNYLKETRRRIDQQELKGPSIPSATGAGHASSSLQSSAMSGQETRLGIRGGSMENRADDAPRTALTALMQDGAEGEALRKMRLMLEEDERKRKRGRKSVGEASSSAGEGSDAGDFDGGSSHSGRKKFRGKKLHKEKKSKKSSKSSRRSSHRKKEREREKGSKDLDRGKDSSDDGNDHSSDTDDTVCGRGGSRGSSKTSKKKTKHKSSSSSHKKKRSSRGDGRGLGSMSPPPGTAAGASIRSSMNGVVSAGSVPFRGHSFSSSLGDEGSGGDTAHPILQRKKHSLWG